MKKALLAIATVASSVLIISPEVLAGVQRVVMKGVNVQTPARKCSNRAGSVDIVEGANVRSAFNNTRIYCGRLTPSNLGWIIDGEVREYNDNHIYFNSGKIYFNCFHASKGQGYSCVSSQSFSNLYVELDISSKQLLSPGNHLPIRLR